MSTFTPEPKARDATIRVTEIEVKQASTKYGQRQYFLIRDGNRTFKTWNEKIASAAHALWNDGKPVYLIYHEETWQGNRGPMTDLMIDELKPGEEANLSPAEIAKDMADAKEERMSKSDWNEKEDREAWRIAWSVVYRVEREQGVEAEEANARAHKLAGLVVTGGKTYANPDLIPFS